jgi:tetratricopeptide (TPR) repeat protein
LAKANDLAGARAAYEQAAAIRIDRADPWLEIAYLYTKEKDAPNAEKAALRGVEVDPESKCYDFVIQASRRYVANREYESAVRVLEPLHGIRPDDLDVTDRLFLSYNNRQQYEDCAREGRGAAELFVKFCSEHPDQPVAPRPFLELFATASAESGHIDATVQWAREKFAAPAPKSAGALVVAALLRQQAAETCLRKTSAEAAEVLATAYDLAPDDTGSLMPQATRIESEKGTDLAEAFLDACAARLPDRTTIRNDQAHFYFQAGVFDKAETLYRALDTDPKPLNTNQSRLLQCLVQQAKLDALDQETARIAKTVAAAAQDGGGQPKITEDERKRLMDQLADCHIRAARELQRRNAVAAQPGPAPPATEAVAYLGKCRERFPDSREIPRTMATLLQGDKRFDEAAAIYQEMLASEPKSANVLEPLLDCLVAQRRYNDALPLLQDRISQIESETQPPKQRADRVSQLETKYADVLSGSDLMRQKIRAASQGVAASPTSATLHSQLAQLLLNAGQGELALSEFLEAAVLSGKGDELVDTALRTAREKRSPLGLSYCNAAIEHFPTHPKIFELIEETLRVRNARDVRFAFAAEGVAAMEDAAADCLRVAAQPDSTPERRVEARMKALLYHLEPLPTEPEVWTDARKKLAAFLDEPDLTPRLRKSVLENLADMDTKRLANPRSAYAIFEDLARQDPTPESLQRVVDAASRLNPRPDPAVLLDYVNKNVMPSLQGALLTRQAVKDEEPSLRMLAMLTAWLWDMGRREEAVALLRPCTEHLADGRPPTRALAKRLLAQVRRVNPDLATQIEAPKPDPAIAGTVRLTRTIVCESGADDLSRAVMYEDTRLDLPRDVFPRQTLTVRATERPAAAEPPVFFQAAGDTSRTWEAVWRPADTTEWRADATDSFAVTTPMVERKQDAVVLRRSFNEEAGKSEILRFDVAVRVAQPCEIVINYGGRWFATPPIEILPEGAAVDKAARTVTFKNLAPALLAAGTTLTLRFQMPDEASGARWRDAPSPSVEMTVSDVARDENLRKDAAGQWGLDTPDGALRYSIAAPDDVTGDVPAKVAVRHQYRLQWFGRP